MTFGEALIAAQWGRVMHPGMQPGCYVAFDVPTGTLRRLWPNGDGCTFRAYDDERERTDWALLDAGWQ